MAVYANPDAPLRSIASICIVFAVVNLPSVSVWAAFGVALRRFLADPVRSRRFNLTMAALLAATLWPMLA